MKAVAILSIAVGVLASVAIMPGPGETGSRFPFVRYWTGHPTFGDLRGWTWNPDGETPEGQVVCDGLEHTLAQIDSTGAPPNLRFVNVQFALGLDGQSSAWITAKLLANDRVVDQATLFHPVQGFAPANAATQNPFHVLPAPVPLPPGALVKFTMACATVSRGPDGAHCGGRALPCASGWAAYGVTFDGISNILEQSNAVSPVFSFSCQGQGPVLDQTMTWSAQGGRVNQATVAYLLAGTQGPGVFTTAPDGQLVSLWTVEDFAAVGGGPFGYQTIYDPDWQILPSGTFTTRVQIECFDPTATAQTAEFFSFP